MKIINLIATIHPTLPCYVSAKGNDTFVYTVEGDAASLKAYKKAKGKYYREEDGVALFFTTDFFGESGNLIITKKGNVIPDKSAYKKAASLASQFDGPLGEAIARQFAEQLLGKAQAPAQSNSVPTKTAPAEEAEEL